MHGIQGKYLVACNAKGILTAMKWSWRLGRFAGIDVYVHITFFILMLAGIVALDSGT